MRIGTIAAVVAMSVSLGAAAHGQAVSPAPPPPPATPDVSPPPHHLDRCPDNIADFENSDATSKLVRQCLGQPSRVMAGRGSDVVWFYTLKAGTITLVMVFDKSGALTHFRAYAHS